MSAKLSRIKQLRSEYNAFSGQTESFTKHYKRLAEAEGIDWFLICCTEQEFETVKTKGNLSQFIK